MEPELSLVGLAVLKVEVVLVGLLDDLNGGLLVESLFVEAEGVEGLVIRGLVPSEPLSDAYSRKK